MILILSLWSVAIVAFISGVALCVYRHIRMSEDRIRTPLQQQLEQHRELLQKDQSARAAQDLFLASLSHELRTPLSGIQGAVQLLHNSGLKGPQHEYVNMISYASATVLEIVDDMLTYSRMQTGSIQVECVPFNVRRMIDDMLALQSIKAQDRGIVLISDIASDVPARLVGDRGKLNQVLLNLIGNAIKFTEEGSVTVSVSMLPDTDSDTGNDPDPDTDTDTGANTHTHTHTKAVANANADMGANRGSGGSGVQLEFTIRDTGVGMSDAELGRIFEPFVQGHAARFKGRQGTGLGLTICRRLLQAIGAELHINSVPQEGTCVSFQLSLEPVDEHAVLAQSHVTHARQRSLVVLVVEDDDINRLVCVRYLALAGHHPVAVADERQVRHVVESSGRVPDVVLMDVNLAGRSGIDLVVEMRTQENEGWHRVPVIAMSADNSGVSRQQAHAGGIPVFLAKPFTATQLYEALDDVTPLSDRDDSKHAHSGHLLGEGESHRDRGAGPIPHKATSGLNLLDEAWLMEETRTLGRDVMLELLNLFRSSAAKTLRGLASTVERKDWQATADLLHCFQGSCSNLGMRYLVEQARALRANILVDGGPHPAYIDAKITTLEALCHASADSLRSWLLSSPEGVAFPTQGHD